MGKIARTMNFEETIEKTASIAKAEPEINSETALGPLISRS